jgi:hypothetical protein
MAADFSGYATKAGLKCADGRTITAEAFKHMDGQTVPLVWQHAHGDAKNILGHAILKARKDGMYAEGFFNETESGKNAKLLVQHKDITNLSIYANKLLEQGKTVLHGVIREVSLVLSGANPGALIDFVQLQHGDDGEIEQLTDEAIIHTGLEIEVDSPEDDSSTEDADPETEEDEKVEHADADATIQDIYDSMDPDQKRVTALMVGQALESVAAEHSDSTDEDALTHQKEETVVHNNVFDKDTDKDADGTELRHMVTQDDMKGIVQSAIRGGSLRGAVEEYAIAHGITNIEVLFPDARSLEDRPEFNKRRTEWVSGVLRDTRHSPFSRVKSIVADLTFEEARAKGYIKGNLKIEEWFGVSKRVTSPTTVYKKQELDRDDVLDITDFDVIVWLKMEMRMMLDEEIARAILISDGRDISNPDKIKDPIGAADGVGIRSILNDHELYVTTVYVNVDDANSTYDEVIDAVMDGMEFFKGTGTPDFYTTIKERNKFLKAKDEMGRRLYQNVGEVASALGVNSVICVEPMNDLTDVVGIIVNLADYNVGTDKGGEINTFDDFDIDYNKQKYLIETRLSGALTKIKSALVIRKTASANVLVDPNTPGFVATTGVITIPTQTGVVYKNAAGTTLTAGAQTALAAGASLVVNAFPASGYYFANNQEDSWTFKRNAA